MNHRLFSQIEQRFESTKYCIFKTDRVVYIGTIENTKTFFVFSICEFSRDSLKKQIVQHSKNESFNEMNKILTSTLFRSLRVKRILRSFKRK
jgi:hypothetical protein